MNVSYEESLQSVFTITSTTINLVLGVPINGCVLWLVLSGPAGTVAAESFTLNLSAFEILFSLLYAFLLVNRTVRLRYFAGGFLFTGRPLFQCCICVERFVAVVHPVLFLKCKPLRYRLACAALSWAVIVGFSLLYMALGVSKTAFYIYIGECLFFMSVMLLCSVAILRALKRPAPGEPAGRDRERDSGMKRRACVIICLIMVSFLVTFFIPCAAAAVFAAGGLLASDQMALVEYVCVFISVVSGLVQPLLHLCRKTGKLPCFKPVQGGGPGVTGGHEGAGAAPPSTLTITRPLSQD